MSLASAAMSLASSVAGRDFFDLVKAIGESKSKQEEDRIVSEEVQYLKKIINDKNISKKKMKELVVRSFYVEMLGQDASFSYIKAVELCASSSILHKKAGYLAASLCFSPEHEFRFMLINQIQRDMNSTNQLESCAALNAVCKIINEDMIPAVITDIVKLLKHDMDAVRKRAVVALHRLYQLDKSCIVEHLDKVRRMLCDKDPAVMGAALPLLLDLSKDNPILYKDLMPSLVSILKQITEHRLPREYDYHRIPAPWLQMHILRILAILGRGDQATSEGMYEVLVDVMRRADTGINVGYALVYEAVHTVTIIYPNPLLLDAAATAISRFIRSDSHNLKYIGIKGLASIVKEHPKYAADHQLAVIDCLEDPDDTLKRKTLDLLYKMTNSVNVEFIVDKLLSFLASATDDYFRTELVQQITQCAERFAPSNGWYISTMVRVFELAGDKVKLSVAQTLMQLIADGQEDLDDSTVDASDELRRGAVEDFLTLIDKPKLSDILAQSIAWVLGEYGYLSEIHSKDTIVDKLIDLLYQSTDGPTKAHIITAIMKLVAQTGSCSARVTSLLNNFCHSMHLDVQQRCIEFKALLSCTDNTIMADVLPVDASCEDIDIDEKLKFLDSYVRKALSNGAVPYSPPASFDNDDDDDARSNTTSTVKFTPYERPSIPVAPPAISIVTPTSTSGNTVTTPTSAAVTAAGGGSSSSNGIQFLNNKGVTQVWGKKMAIPEPTIETTSSPAATPATTTTTTTATAAATTSPFGIGSVFNSGTTTTVSTPVASNEPIKPRELTEKEKMAAALFGGVSNSKSVGITKRRSSGGAVTATNNGTSSSSGDTDLFGGMSTVESVATPATTTAVTDLFGGMSISTASPPVSTPLAPVPVDLDILDLAFNTEVSTATSATTTTSFPEINMVPSNPPPPVPPVVTATTTNSISDMFADMSNPLPSPPPLPTTLMTTSTPSNQLLTGMSSFDILSNTSGSTAKPLLLTTNEFGIRWGQCPCEMKQFITCPRIRSLELLRTTMPSNYAHVESIPGSNEAIFAALSFNGSNLLLHVKLGLQRSGFDITIKGVNRDVISNELTHITTVFA